LKTLISIFITGALIASMFLFGFAKKPGEVKIGYIRHAANLPFFVALEKDYFKQEGIKVKAVECGFKELLDALITGRVDVIPPMSFPHLLSIEAESPGLIKIFLIGGEKMGEEINSGILVRKGSSIRSIENLKGKTIGVTSPTAEFNLKLTLNALGLKLDKDFTILMISEKLATTSLAMSKIDALWSTEPDLTIAIEKANAELLVGNLRAKYILDPYWAGAAAVKAEFVEKHPKTMKRILKAFDRAIDLIRENPSESKKVLPKYTPLAADIAQKSGIYFFIKSTETVDMGNLRKLTDLLYKYEVLKKKVDPTKMYISSDNL
jgi:ABC-type nitrate/sulfonate/bicarbonate transport system substrate-binding protein